MDRTALARLACVAIALGAPAWSASGTEPAANPADDKATTFDRVTVHGFRAPAVVPIAELCPGSVPKYLAGATALVVGPPTGWGNVNNGNVKITLEKNRPIFAAVTFSDDEGTGNWQEQMLKRLDMPGAGWALVGELTVKSGKAVERRWLYWRPGGKPEVVRLRTRKVIAPIIIVPAADAGDPLAEQETAAAPEYAPPEHIAKQLLRENGWRLLQADRFDALDTLIRKLRGERSHFPSGASKLRFLYEGIAGSFARDDAAWCLAQPKSVAPRIAWAEAMLNHALVNRELGERMKRAKADDAEYQQRLDRSVELFDEAQGLDEKDPELYRGLVLVAISLGWEPNLVRDVLRSSAAVDPSYLDSFFQATRYLYLQRYQSERPNAHQWALEAVDLTKIAWGHYAYTTMVLDAKRFFADDDIFTEANYSWELTKQGFLDADARLPKSNLRQHEFCHFACLAGDRATARQLFTQLDSRNLDELELVWADPFYFDGWRAWARPDFLAGQQARVVLDGRRQIHALRWTSDGRRLVTADDAHDVRVWDVATGKQLLSMGSLGDDAGSLAISADDQLAATGDGAGAVILWNLVKQEARLLGKQDARITQVAFSDDGLLLAAGTLDGTVVLWDVASGERRNEWKPGEGRAVRGVVFSRDGKQLIIAADNRRTVFLDLASGKPAGRLPDRPTAPRGLALSPDGTRLALAESSEVTLWKLPAGELLGTFAGAAKRVNDIAFSPDGLKLACAAGWTKGVAPSDAIVWDVVSRERLHTFEGHKGAVTGVVFSPDGKQLATSSLDMTLRLWQVQP